MSIEIACKCGKRLRARDDQAGKRVKCPACGQILNVAHPDAETDKLDYDVDLSDERKRESEAEEDGAARRRKKKKKRKRESGFALALRGLGDFLVANARILIFLVVIVGSVSALTYILMPAPAYQVLEVQPVEAYLALDHVRAPKRSILQAGAMEKAPGDYLSGGSGKYVVLRDNPEGQFLAIKIRVAHKFLMDKGMVQHGTITFQQATLHLEGDGNSIPCLFLLEERPNKVEVDIFLARNLEAIVPPNEAAAEGIFPPGKRKNTVKVTDFDKDGFVLAAEGEAEFTSPTGMHVHHAYHESMLTITWDPQSHGWFNENLAMGTEDIFNKFDVFCLFRRPSKKDGITLRVADGPPVKVRVK